MAATLHHRMVKIQPDLVVMSIIPNDLNLSRTPTIARKGYLVDQKISVLLDSPLRNVLREVHLLYIIREISIRWIFPSQNIDSLLLLAAVGDWLWPIGNVGGTAQGLSRGGGGTAMQEP